MASDQIILRDDQFITSSDKSILNRGMLFGDGFFESMFCNENGIRLLDYHIDRINNASEKLKLNFNISAERLTELVSGLINEKKLIGDVRARLTVYRKGYGTYTPEMNESSYFIMAANVPQHTGYIETCGLYTEQTKGKGIVSGFKSLSSQLYVMASIYAVENKLDDVFVINSEGNIIESTNSNMFLVKENIIITPPLSEGCVDGVYRRYMIDTCRKLNYQVTEKSVTPEDVKSADELWVTNAVLGLRGIKNYLGKNYKTTHADSILKQNTVSA